MPSAAATQSVKDVTKQTRLSTQTVEAMRPAPAGTRLEHRDTGCPGLRLRVSQHGAKTWSVVYRVRGTGVDGTSKGDPKRASLGAYPHIKLDKARALARDAMDAADEGRDWAAERKAAAETAKALEVNRAEEHPGLIKATKFLWHAWAADKPGRVPIDRTAVTAIAAELTTPFRVSRGESERRVTTILREWDKRPNSEMPGRGSGNRYSDGVRVS